MPSSDLLTALKGKDVVIAFIESYGQVAVQGTSFSSGVTRCCATGTRSSRPMGTPPERLPHLADLRRGQLAGALHVAVRPVDRLQQVYNKLLKSNRFTLSDAFRNAGWNTVSDVPSDTHPWSYGSSFYHYGTMLDTNNVGYLGPTFGYARIPDQYTWKYF